MWPFTRRQRFVATNEARKALGVSVIAELPPVIAEAIETDMAGPLGPSSVTYAKPNSSDDLAAMSSDRHLKIAQRMVEKLDKRAAELNEAIAVEFEQHRQADEAELQNHHDTMKHEADRHSSKIGELRKALEEALALAAGYQGLRDTLTPPVPPTDVEPPAPAVTADAPSNVAQIAEEAAKRPARVKKAATPDKVS